MPELPEVETVRRALTKKILNIPIIEVEVFLPKMINLPISEFKQNLVRQSFINIDRMGKWLIMELTNGVLLSHLRMEGRYYFQASEMPILKHQHIIIYFENNMSLRYIDTRQFGKMMWFPDKSMILDYLSSRIGPEPWDHSLDALLKSFANKSIPIKSALLDQKIIAGIGNIYADEILFLSKINPLTPAKELSKKKVQTIIDNAIEVLTTAIDQGGTTIRDFESELGQSGHYQNQLHVHTKVNQPCPVCNTPILKIKVGGRGTYYCPKCQKR